MPSTSSFALPSSRMKMDAVEPEPRPTIMPPRISLSAARAACRLRSSFIKIHSRAADRLPRRYEACVHIHRVAQDHVSYRKQPAYPTATTPLLQATPGQGLFWKLDFQSPRKH